MGMYYFLEHLHGKTKDIRQIFHQHIHRVKLTVISFFTYLQNSNKEESISAIPGISRATIASSRLSASSGVSITIL